MYVAPKDLLTTCLGWHLILYLVYFVNKFSIRRFGQVILGSIFGDVFLRHGHNINESFFFMKFNLEPVTMVVDGD